MLTSGFNFFFFAILLGFRLRQQSIVRWFGVDNQTVPSANSLNVRRMSRPFLVWAIVTIVDGKCGRTKSYLHINWCVWSQLLCYDIDLIIISLLFSYWYSYHLFTHYFTRVVWYPLCVPYNIGENATEYHAYLGERGKGGKAEGWELGLWEEKKRKNGGRDTLALFDSLSTIF